MSLTKAEVAALLKALPKMKPAEQVEVLATLEEMERRERRREMQEDFLKFIQYMDDKYVVGPHHKHLSKLLVELAAGEKDRITVSIAPRMGKLCADDTPIFTPDGWRRHGDLRVGDYVFHPSGVPVRVLAVSPKAPANMRVQLSTGDVIYCHEAHEWTVKQAGAAGWRTMETQQLMSRALRSEKGRRNYGLPLVHTFQTPDIPLPMDPYMLGVWLGDGSKGYGRIYVAPAGRPVVAEVVARGYTVSAEHVHATTGVSTVVFGGAKYHGGRLSQELTSLDLKNDKHIPEIFLRAGTRQKLELLAGLIDTDGSVDKNGRYVFFNANERLARGVMSLVRSLGWYAYMSVVAPRTSSSGVAGKQPVYQVGFHPQQPLPCQIPHKQHRRNAVRRMVGIDAITYDPCGKVGHCIQVDSPDGLYVVGENHAVTHNSHMVSTYYPAWFIGKYPNQQIMLVSHTTDLAVDFGRKVRNVVDSAKFREVFPGVALAADSKSAGRWNTSHGGVFFATGVGSALAGRGADLLIIDDPHSEQDILAGNYEVFDKAYDWYAFGARTRLMPGGRVAIVATRWSPDDLIGRVIKDSQMNEDADQWEVVEFPAILPSGAALWPEWWPLEALERTKASMPHHQWAAQYLQQPTSEEGAIVKREWWQEWRSEKPPQCDIIIVSWDTAHEKNNRSDYSACTIWGVWQNEEDGVNHLILLDAFKGRWEFPMLKEKFLEVWKEWKPDAVVVEKKASGAPLIQDMRYMGIPVQEFVPSRGNDKVARLNSVSDLFASGRVWAPATRWAEEVIEEVAGFPSAKHDDYVDSCTQALMRFRQGGYVGSAKDEKEEPKYFKRRSRGYY